MRINDHQTATGFHGGAGQMGKQRTFPGARLAGDEAMAPQPVRSKRQGHPAASLLGVAEDMGTWSDAGHLRWKRQRAGGMAFDEGGMHQILSPQQMPERSEQFAGEQMR